MHCTRGVKRITFDLQTHREFHSAMPRAERPESKVTDVSPRRGAGVVVVVVDDGLRVVGVVRTNSS